MKNRLAWAVLWIVVGLLIGSITPSVAGQGGGVPVCFKHTPNDTGMGGMYEIIDCPVAPTATPSPTDTPWVTFTAVFSPTPTQMSTPIPSMTPSHTPDVVPTQEKTPLPPTFTVTPVPTKVCTLRANGDNMRIRSGPGTDYGTIGKWTAGTEEIFTLFAYDDHEDYLWGYHSRGWSAVYQPPLAKWYVDGTQAALFCPPVEGWPPGLIPPPPIARTIKNGPHMLAGEGGSTPLQFAHNLTAGKVLPGSLHLGPQLKALNPDAWIVCRLFTDSIASDNDYDADVVWELVHRSIPEWCDAFELENEHTPQTEEGLRGWSKFNIDFASRLAYYKNIQLLAYVYGPGWPEYHETIYMVEYLEWVALNPLPDGRYHGVASHAAVYAPWNRPNMPWVNEEHIAGRVVKIADYLLEHTGFDLYNWPGEWALTEFGLSDGYSGNWSAEYSCEEAASALHYSIEVHTEEGIVTAILWWNFGAIGMWTSDHDCAALMYG